MDTASVTAAPAGPPAMRPAQLEAQLWDDERLRVFAVVMGSRIPDLPQRLASADIVDHDCLRPGALTRAEQLEAAYLVQLQRGSEFGRWLLFEAAATLPDWGVVVLTAAAPLALRSHLRALSEARLPEGASIELEWMDPVILRALLPHFDASALRGFMGPIQAWVIPGAAQWHRAELVTGQLQWREAALAKGT